MSVTMLMILHFMLVTQTLIQRLEHHSMLAIEWFESNYMRLNDKCHLLLSGYKHEVMWARPESNMGKQVARMSWRHY